MEEVVAFEWATKVDEARHLVMMWARVVEVELQLAGTLEGYPRVGATKRRPPRYKYKPLATRIV